LCVGGSPGEGEEREIEVDLLQVVDVLKVVPGAKVPTDGVIIKGITSCDEAMITGEAVPVTKEVGDKVIGGSLNCEGVAYFRVTELGEDTVLANIVKLVEDAQTNKAPVQAIADTISSYFVPVVCAISLVVFVMWLTLAATGVIPDDWTTDHSGTGHSSKPEDNPFLFAFGFGIAVLVIACPCALGLATPTAVMVATGVGARYGILVKGGEPLETAHKVTTIAFDKTGTLTVGKPSVVVSCIESESQTGLSRSHVLALVYRAEESSEHPLGRALAEYCSEEGTAKDITMQHFEAKPGRGLECLISDRHVLVGNRAWLAENKVTLPLGVEDTMKEQEEKGCTVVMAAVDNKYCGWFAMSDTLKEGVAEVVDALHRQGIMVCVLTGDNARTAKAALAGIDIDHLFAEVLPSEKASKVAHLQADGEVVAMVGDGVNDSPALAQANVGIAIGAGTDVALETAKVVLMQEDLANVLRLIELSSKTFDRIRWNFVWALGFNTVGIPLAAGVLFPAFQIALPPMFAGMAMAFSSVAVVTSSLLLKRVTLEGHSQAPRLTAEEQRSRRYAKLLKGVTLIRTTAVLGIAALFILVMIGLSVAIMVLAKGSGSSCSCHSGMNSTMPAPAHAGHRL